MDSQSEMFDEYITIVFHILKEFEKQFNLC